MVLVEVFVFKASCDPSLIKSILGDASFDEFGVARYQPRRTMSSSDRALITAFKEINSMADRINLPRTIVDRANNLFKQVHDGRNLKGLKSLSFSKIKSTSNFD